MSLQSDLNAVDFDTVVSSQSFVARQAESIHVLLRLAGIKHEDEIVQVSVMAVHRSF